MATLVGCPYHILPVCIIQFLTLKRRRPDFLFPQVNDDDIYGFDPSELPGRSKFQSDDQVWYFFCKLKNVPSKSPTSLVARAAGAGYWKSTGRGSAVKNKDGNKIGWKRNLVYYKRERGPPPKEIKTKWVMHEFYVADSPLYKENYVICYIEKQPNKQPSVSTPSDDQPSSSSASESVHHNIEGTFTEVESLQLQSHFLISDSLNHVTENTSTELCKVSPQPISSENLVSDSRDHAANKAFPVEPQQIRSTLVSYSENHAVENTFSPVMKSMPHDSFQHQSVVDPQLPLHPSLVSGSRNHGTDNIFVLVKSSQPAEFGAFNGYNVQKPCASTKNEDRPAKKPRVLFNDEAQASHNVAFNDEIRNCVIENTSPESQCDSISNHVAENISELQPLPSCSSISDSGHHAPETPEFVSQVDSVPPWAPDQTVFSSLLSPMYPEGGSSYSGVTIGDYNVFCSPLGFEWEDYRPNLPCTFEVECPFVGTGYSTPLYFNS